MNTYRLYQVDAFTKERFRGNPAGVVTNAANLTAEQMQRIARELNNSETAFILPPTDSSHDVQIRFFTPTTEVPLCGHATIAAHYVLAREQNGSRRRLVQKSRAGLQEIEIVASEEDYQVVMTQQSPIFGDILTGDRKSELLRGLRIADAQLNSTLPIQIVSTGHSKVLVPLRCREDLNNLQPDFQRLAQLSEQIGCNGYFTFAIATENDEYVTHGRMFAPAIGINEDPVTGMANGPLGAYLVHYKVLTSTTNPISFLAQQGEAIGRLGKMTVNVTHSDGEPTVVSITGKAVVVFKAELTL